ncbi:MAG: phosphoenolpyruvate--protein phosphotransferase [Kiritimatiellae bacterium]|nr:phosphoenolpyruvate--protein phosphotransferase [Kiritimatiellia bacterium]
MESSAVCPPVMCELCGLPVSRGCVSGRAVVLAPPTEIAVPEFTIDDCQAEIDRLDEAISKSRSQLLNLSAELNAGREIFDGMLMMLDDPLVLQSCRDEITQYRVNAELAVKRMTEKFSNLFAEMDDPYLRERSRDVRDISDRIIRNLLGRFESRSRTLSEPSILVSDSISPAELLSFSRPNILGIITVSGSVTSHVALLARAFGIPSVTSIAGLLDRVSDGDFLLLDGTSGRVVANPSAAEQAAFALLQERARLDAAELAAECGRPAATADGRQLKVLANTDANTPHGAVAATGADGIGLYRSEYLWLSLNRTPTEEEQTAAYSAMLREVPAGQPVVIRMLDIGGDKVMRDGRRMQDPETNPFLGNRSIRFLLDNPDEFRRQIRAVLRASSGGNLRLMYPMVSTLEELRAANLLVEDCKSELQSMNVPFNPGILRGSMVEVPSAALIADDLAKECDFISIGTNDLIQYTLAADRQNDRVARLYQPTHPAVLRLIKRTIDAGNAAGIPVSVCGECAADPVVASLLIGMGATSLSVSPSLIPLVKRTLRSFTWSGLQALACDTLDMMSGKTGSEVYQFCKERVKP